MTEIDVDIVQLFDGINRLNNNNIITNDECGKLKTIFTDKDSYGPSLSNKRMKISYTDMCIGLSEIPTIISDTHKVSRVWEIIGSYVKLAIQIHKTK